MRRGTYYITIGLSVVLCLATIGLTRSPQVDALSGSEFQAGRIMDDGVFFNPSSMSAQDIQNFLDAKVPVCDRWHASSDPNNQPPFTCLKEYRQNTTSKPAEAGLCNGHTAGNKSSAQIIYEVAQSCGVSAKVLMVMLQKEQSLITDTWPWYIQYRSAMGYGCPDTAPCDAEYYGFFNQVYAGARQFKYYAKNSASFNYRAGRNNYILWNPNSACGGSNVYIQNQATAGLYVYTPYQPNQAALNNLYGSGDGCSAYGNRNFWRMYNDWFGSPYASSYFLSPAAQSAYPTIQPGGQVTAYFSYKNWGTTAWYDSTVLPQAPAGTKPINLSTARPLNRSSAFSSGWPTPSRPAVAFAAVYEADGTTLAGNQHVAQPGQVVKFSFTLSAPSSMTPGVYREFFQPVAEGSGDGAFNDPWTFIDVTVASKPSMAWHGQSAYPTVLPADKSTASMSFKNTGNVNLYDDIGLGQAPAGTNPLHLATKSPLNRSSAFSSGWPTPSRPAVNFAAVYEANGTSLSSNQHVAQPGQIVKFDFTLTAQEGATASVYREDFQPILEGTPDGGLTGVGAFTDITIPQSAVITYTVLPNTVQLISNLPGSMNLTIKNSGNTPLPGSTKLTTPNGSSFKDSTWSDNNTIIGSIGPELAPLQTRNLSFAVLSPEVSGPTNAPVNIAFKSQDGINTVPLSSASFATVIAPPTYQSGNVSQSSYPAYTYGQTQRLYFKYRNIGNQYWYDSTSLPTASTRNPYAVHLATNDPLNRHSGFAKDWPSSNRSAINFTTVYESDGTTLTTNQHLAKPGQIVKFEFNTSPSTALQPGVYREFFQPIAEGTADGKFNRTWTFFDITLHSPTYVVANHAQSAYPTINRGQQTTVFFSYKNNGNAPWYDSASIPDAPSNARPMHMATSHHLNRSSAFSSGWPTPSRPAVAFAAVYEADGTTLAGNQHVAQPGQVVKFSFTLSAPSSMTPGVYREFFQPVAEGSGDGAFNDPWTHFDVTVQ